MKKATAVILALILVSVFCLSSCCVPSELPFLGEGDKDKENLCEDGNEHRLSDVTVEATCTTDGYVAKTCTVCGYVSATESIKATGHSYADGICSLCQKPEGWDYTVAETVEKSNAHLEKGELKAAITALYKYSNDNKEIAEAEESFFEKVAFSVSPADSLCEEGCNFKCSIGWTDNSIARLFGIYLVDKAKGNREVVATVSAPVLGNDECTATVVAQKGECVMVEIGYYGQYDVRRMDGYQTFIYNLKENSFKEISGLYEDESDGGILTVSRFVNDRFIPFHVYDWAGNETLKQENGIYTYGGAVSIEGEWIYYVSEWDDGYYPIESDEAYYVVSKIKTDGSESKKLCTLRAPREISIDIDSHYLCYSLNGDEDKIDLHAPFDLTLKAEAPTGEMENYALYKDYTLTRDGSYTAPEYLYHLYKDGDSKWADRYLNKMTDGFVGDITDGDYADLQVAMPYVSVMLPGTNSSYEYVFDLEGVYDDIRSVVFRQVRNSSASGGNRDFSLYAVFVSEDGENWTEVKGTLDKAAVKGAPQIRYPGNNPEYVTEHFDYVFNAETAAKGRYVSVMIGSGSGYIIQLEEIEIWNTER